MPGLQTATDSSLSTDDDSGDTDNDSVFGRAAIDPSLPVGPPGSPRTAGASFIIPSGLYTIRRHAVSSLVACRQHALPSRSQTSTRTGQKAGSK